MPKISEFQGIVIAMYYDDHPPPHFHARHGGRSARVTLLPPRLLDDELPRSMRRPVLRWARRHEQELLANWWRARRKVPLEQVAPAR